MPVNLVGSHRTRVLSVALIAVILACGCARSDPGSPEDVDGGKEAMAGRATAPVDDLSALRFKARQIFGVLPTEALSETHVVTEAKVRLGRMLYYEPRLSKNHDISCNSCHLLTEFGVDRQPTSPGHRGQRGNRNSPTVYNAAFQVAQFWDGRAADVEEQALGPILNPVEMAMASADDVVGVLRSIPGYEPIFRTAFPDAENPITYDHIGIAIGAFERRLVTPSRFDDYLESRSTLTDEELRGLSTFIATGCPTCHMGPTLGGSSYQRLGLVHPYETQDLGRFELTQNPGDRHVFKVPTLRNVAETHPYFHDGSVAKLKEAIRLMAYHQLGKDLSVVDTEAIAAFLGSLTGRIDGAFIARPELPPGGSETPAPDPS